MKDSSPRGGGYRGSSIRGSPTYWDAAGLALNGQSGHAISSDTPWKTFPDIWATFRPNFRPNGWVLYRSTRCVKVRGGSLISN